MLEPSRSHIAPKVHSLFLVLRPEGRGAGREGYPACRKELAVSRLKANQAEGK